LAVLNAMIDSPDALVRRASDCQREPAVLLRGSAQAVCRGRQRQRRGQGICNEAAIIL
jgi:hypothetical protein